jgi:hypothetical protein
MSDPAELIVEFTRGVSESEAQATIMAAGGTIRRRMRTDHDDQVMLLVKVDADRLSEIETFLEKNPHVSRFEKNAGGFSVAD